VTPRPGGLFAAKGDLTAVDLTDLAIDWTARYEAAWRTPGTELLAGLFTHDATYLPAPFAEPLQGLADIARMWEAERAGPDEPFTMTAEPVAASDGRAVVRVEVRYGPPTHAHYRDLWVVHLRDDGLCHLFEEWPFWPPGTPGTIAGADASSP
jgi:ketosteroid isomerase-like protein